MAFQDPDVPTREKVKKIIDSLDKGDEDDFDQILAEYEFSLSRTIQEVLEELVISEQLPSDRKYRVLSTMYSSRGDMSPEDTSKLEKLISAYIPESSVLEFETLRWLLSFGNGSKHLNRLYKYLSNPNIQDLFKYNQIFGLRQSYPVEVLAGVTFMLTNSDTKSRCRVLCSQYVFENAKGYIPPNTVENLLKIAQDKKEDYNIRADAADALHHYAEGEIQGKALDILRELGGNSTNIYENKQNVHNVDISEGLALIGEIIPQTKYKDISKLITNEDKDPKIASSLGRIVMDTTRYGKKGVAHISYSAEEIMERIWEYIQTRENSESKTTLRKRLVEELRDMADTCSSGHALRLINVLSGMGANVRISFIDQISSSFEGRLNARLRNINDEEEKAQVYLDMVDKGMAFMKFFMNTYPLVVKELREEYVDGGYVTIDEFDVAIGNAMKPYEGRGSTSKIEFKLVKHED